jgi:hypothetical protein
MGRHLDTIDTPGDLKPLPPDAVPKLRQELPGAHVARQLAGFGLDAAGIAAVARALVGAAAAGARETA